MNKFLRKILGTSNERMVGKFAARVTQINALESQMQAISDDGLKAKTLELKNVLKKGATLDSLLVEAFAVCREAGRRSMNMRHYDVQLIGGMVLHTGQIAEMKTGEGKTLVATLPLYLNALTEKGVHLVTVNDYLAKRDAEWMSPIYEALGMRVGVIVHGLSDEERKFNYAADITYGTNNEFGFDYLRDNMKINPESLVQRDLNFSIVDEVDSILIDEARTPLIISGPTNDTTDKYKTINRIIPFLKQDVHYTVDEKGRTAALTDEGVDEVQSRLNIDNLYDPRFIDFLHHVDQALKAYALFKKDVDYVVKDGEVIIVDEFTGRLMPGRRYSDGLHQALEAKEGVQVANENQTLASITFQNYFRMYNKLGGMTGTADTEAEEFASIYKLEVVVVPTNREMVRKDMPDVIFKSEVAKFRAIVKDIKDRYEKGQPVLVGTTSIEKSERLSEFLKKERVAHVVLNAKQHEREAHIVADAGKKGAVTIATNMAGRGTDIKLEEGVTNLGGLYILGTERHESRRIDNQLRGRAGRQGDPGESRFYLSLEDDLLRIFAGERMLKVMNFLGMEEDEPIEANMVSRAIEDAQNRVEARNFDIRKHLLKYDDVMNYQRKVVYGWRKKVLFKNDIRSDIDDIAAEVIETICNDIIPAKTRVDQFDWSALKESIEKVFNSDLGLQQMADDSDARHSKINSDQHLFEQLFANWKNLYLAKEKEMTEAIMRRLERMLLLNTLDDRWKDHLLDVDHLRDGINLRGYAQKDPILDYQNESYRLFEAMFLQVKQEFLEKIHRIRMSAGEGSLSPEEDERQREAIENRIEEEQRMREERAKKLQFVGGGSSESSTSQKPQTVKREADKVGRNDPCPCGSGKKYKKCHGASALAG